MMAIQHLPDESDIQKDMQTCPVTLSVIIPAYQASATIGRALQSIALQTVLPNEVIIIDDGSDDGTNRGL